MKNKNELLSEVWSLWGIQESLLQTYRTFFISSESILLAMSVTVLTISSGHNALYVSILAIPGIFLMSMWRSICSARARDVTFTQLLLLKIERNEISNIEPLTEFKKYQSQYNKKGYILSQSNNEEWRLINDSALNDKEFSKMLESPTRLKMDKTLPNVYAFIWVTVVILGALSLAKT